MKLIYKGRGEGKTTELIKLSVETNTYILVKDQQRQRQVADLAQALGYDSMLFPVTLSEHFAAGKSKGMINRRFLIDDADDILQYLIGVDIPILACSWTKKDEESTKFQEKIDNAKPSTWLTDGLTDEEVKKALRGSCSMCEWEDEVNGEHCYECINDIKNNYTEKRDCENCKHRIPTVDIVKGKSTYGCESWECKFEPKDVDECPMQAFYEMKADECKAHNGNCKECNMECDIEEDEVEE